MPFKISSASNEGGRVGTPFMSEVKIISWNFAPKGWAFCNGQFLPINQNQALFSLLGTMYGGNGQTTFALPDLRGRTAIHQGQGFQEGQPGGEEFHTITQNETPTHIHFMSAVTEVGNTTAPSGNWLARSATEPYRPLSSPTTMHPSSITNIGGSQAHENRQPFLVLNFVIALQGAFPSRN
jgi:microcystin-dependent protein